MTNSDPSSFQLGKLPATVDPRTLRLADFIDYSQLPSFPSSYKDSDKIANWKMLGNDRYGDCVVAGETHQEMLFSQLAGTPWVADETTVIDTYFQLTGGRDIGLNILEYLKWRRKNNGASSKKMLGFAAVDWRNPNEVAVAISMFHGILTGILLPNTAKLQSSPNNVWDTVVKSGNGTPGSWGGHLTLETDYDLTTNMFANITWGYVQKLTHNFMLDYFDESFCVIPNYNIPGFKYDDFVSALKQIDPNADFDPPSPSPIPVPPPSNRTFHLDRFEHKEYLKYDDNGQEFIWLTAGKYY
jgi:hypothetical protein